MSVLIIISLHSLCHLKWNTARAHAPAAQVRLAGYRTSGKNRETKITAAASALGKWVKHVSEYARIANAMCATKAASTANAAKKRCPW